MVREIRPSQKTFAGARVLPTIGMLSAEMVMLLHTVLHAIDQKDKQLFRTKAKNNLVPGC